MKSRPWTIVSILMLVVIGAVLVAVFVWPGLGSRPSPVVPTDPQPPTEWLWGGPERDEVATDLMGQPIYTYAVHSLAFSHDSQFLAYGAGDGNGVRVDLSSLLQPQNDQAYLAFNYFAAHENWTFAIDFLDDGTLVTGGGDDLLVRWSDAFEPLMTYSDGGHTDDVHALAISPDEQRLYSTGDDRRLIAWNLEDGSVIYDITPHDEQVPAMRLSPDGSVIATGSRDDKVRLFDAPSGDLIHTLDDHKDDVLDLAFSPDGEQIASASYDTTVCIYYVYSGELVQTLHESTGRVFATAFSADGAYLAAGGEDGTLVIYEVLAGYRIHHTVDTPSDISRLAFSSDGRWLASSSSSGVVALYDAQTFDQVKTMRYEITEPEQPSP